MTSVSTPPPVTETAPPAKPVPVPEKLRCVNCGKSVVDRPRDSACGQCQAPVERSWRTFHHRYAPVPWLRRVRHGLTLVIVSVGLFIAGVAAFVGWMLLSYVAAAAHDQPVSLSMTELGVIALLTFIPAKVLQLVSIYMFTTPRPDDSTRYDIILRSWLRWSVGLIAVGFVAGWGVALLPPGTMPEETRSAIRTVVEPLNTTLFLFVPVMIVGFLAHLLSRLSRPALEGFARVICWCLLLSATLTLVVQIVTVKGGFRQSSLQSIAVGAADAITNAGQAPPDAVLVEAPPPPPLLQLLQVMGTFGVMGFGFLAFVLVILSRKAVGLMVREILQDALPPPPPPGAEEAPAANAEVWETR